MPEEFVRREASLIFAKFDGDDAVHRLAVKFQVPKEAMYFRLFELGISITI